MKLPPFDAKAKCPKCGNEEIGSVYTRPGDYLGSDTPNGLPYRMHANQHCIVRACRRCAYRWAEAPLDAEGGT